MICTLPYLPPSVNIFHISVTKIKKQSVFPHFYPHFHANNIYIYIQVLYENNGAERDILPHVMYVSRENRPKMGHHYKAGAMNVMVILFLSNLS